MDNTNQHTSRFLTNPWDLDMIIHGRHHHLPYGSVWSNTQSPKPTHPTQLSSFPFSPVPTPAKKPILGQDTEGDEEQEEDLSAMKEMMYKIAAMQPVNIDPATIRKPARRNVRISNDPQSAAARHRRERISEKIRILQRLVPGGTKMDTASMLDEATRYVKFLKRHIRQLQLNQNQPFGGAIAPPYSAATSSSTGLPFIGPMDPPCSAASSSSGCSGIPFLGLQG